MKFLRSFSKLSYPHPLHYQLEHGKTAIYLVKDTIPIGWMVNSTFEENPTFESKILLIKKTDFLHSFLSKEIPKDLETQSIAQRQKEGFLNIGDQRCFTAYGNGSLFIR
jgi:hypothetical protein